MENKIVPTMYNIWIPSVCKSYLNNKKKTLSVVISTP